MRVHLLKPFVAVAFVALACMIATQQCKGQSTSDKLDSGVATSGIVHSFERQALTKTYFSEGSGVGDLNGDGHADVVYGPYWFEGPAFKTSHEIYPPKPQPMNAYEIGRAHV